MFYGKWSVTGYDESTEQGLEARGLSPLVAALLASRGMVQPGDLDMLSGLKPGLADPFALRDMEKAVARVRRAIVNKEHVAVYGDYDADGITSSCLVYDYLTSRGLTCEVYIPDRLEDGYGISNAALEQIASMGVTLIITVDVGVTAVEEVKFAASLGLELVITDHHKCGAQLPEACAVVDPCREDDESETMLAGVGVAFKLLCALEGKGKLDELLLTFGDLVAIGTVADLMPILGENRTLVLRGLESVRTGRRMGLRRLISDAGLELNAVASSDISFVVAPRLNAAGRMGHTHCAFELLATTDPVKAATLSARLCELNLERRDMETETLEGALTLLGHAHGKPVILASDQWHQGVAGIVAARLAERLGVPAIMICLVGDSGRGSCRSFGGFNLYEALTACSGLLSSFGGHALAAGLTIERKNIDAFREAFVKYYAEHHDRKRPDLQIDFETRPELLTIENTTDLCHMEPFGNGFPQPLLSLTEMYVSAVTPIGKGKHVKLRLSKGRFEFDGLFFRRSGDEVAVSVGDYIDTVFVPKVNEFRGRCSVQLLLRDIRSAGATLVRVKREGELMRLLRDGGPFTPALRTELLPTREQLAAVWRQVEAGIPDGDMFVGMTRLANLIPGCSVNRCFAALRIFAEAGLLTIDLEDGFISVTPSPERKKVSLSISPLFRALTGQRRPDNG